jgi:hypothetical protein
VALTSQVAGSANCQDNEKHGRDNAREGVLARVAGGLPPPAKAYLNSVAEWDAHETEQQDWHASVPRNEKLTTSWPASTAAKIVGATMKAEEMSLAEYALCAFYSAVAHFEKMAPEDRAIARIFRYHDASFCVSDRPASRLNAAARS